MIEFWVANKSKPSKICESIDDKSNGTNTIIDSHIKMMYFVSQF